MSTEQLIAQLRSDLAKTHKALAMGAYGAKYTSLRDQAARLERQLRLMGLRP